ncbi:MAG: putative RNA uridine N3 methyltransferase [Desulfurococcaceae archaeon]
MVKTRIRVALPSSILSVEPSLIQKSFRVHQVARWTSIFGVSEVVFYKDFSTSTEEFNEHLRIIREHWKYLFTPPYLRKILVPLSPELKYAGMLPPIRLNVFNVSRKPISGEERLAYVFRGSNGELKAHLGSVEPFKIIGECSKVNSVVLVKVISSENREAVCLDKEVYRGPVLASTSSLKETVTRYRGIVDYIIVTDRKGSVPTLHEVEGVRGRDLLILFGSPKYDLFELSEQEHFRIQDYADFIWNTVPEQKVATVRTEEALIITLAIVNIYLKGI